jgi:tryptophan-rich sensory protein
MTASSPTRPRWLSARSLLVLAASLAICFVAAQLGSSVTQPNLDWYGGLEKPWFRPPNLAFPVVWTILFAMMAVALWRVVVIADGAERRGAVLAFAVQLAFNVAWSFAFFGAHSPALGLAVIGALLIAIAWTIARFRRIDGFAAALLLPYLAWVAFAALLNAAILFLNA